VQKTFSTAADLGRTLSGGEQIFLSVNVNGNAGDRFDVAITSDEGEISQSTIETLGFNKERGGTNPIGSSEARRMTRIAMKAEQAAITRLAMGTRGRLTAEQNTLIAYSGIVAKTEALIAGINAKETEVAGNTPVEDMVLAHAPLSTDDLRRLTVEVDSIKGAVGFKAHETRLYLSSAFESELQTEELEDWYRRLPLAGRKAFLSVWRGGEYGLGGGNADEWEVGKLLFDHTHRGDLSLAVAKAYAEHPKEVEEFVKVARQTYVVSEEYASNGEVLPVGPGNGNFTWEGVFGWLEEQKSRTNLDQNDILHLRAAQTGLMATLEILNFENNMSPESVFSHVQNGELSGDFKVYLQTHDVRDTTEMTNTGFDHLSLLIIPIDQNQYVNDNRFSRINGRVAFTIGGNWGKKLTANFNRGSDIQDHPLDHMVELERPNQFSSPSEWITALINNTVQFKENSKKNGKEIDYDLFPIFDVNSNGHNSNSFIAGLLEATNTQKPDLSIFTGDHHPGWNHPVPSEYFTSNF